MREESRCWFPVDASYMCDEPQTYWGSVPCTLCGYQAIQNVHRNDTYVLASNFRYQSETVKYLDLHFDRNLTWKEHITKKMKQLDHKIRGMQCLLEKHFPLSLENKLLIHKTILKPIWTYGIVLWGWSSKSNITIMQRYQSKILRTITNAPWYVTNQTLHTDLQIPFVHTASNSAFINTALHWHLTQTPCGSNATPRAQQEINRRWTFDTNNWGDVNGRSPRPPLQPPAHWLIVSNCTGHSDC
jgi:hypothetical protein